MPDAERRPTLRTALLAGLVAVHLIYSLWAVTPGHLSIDEGTYHFMVRSWSDGHGVEVWNGYREAPSPELAAAATFSVEDGRLVAVPPELYPLLALPFYELLGYRGLFLLNALAFLGLLVLTRDVALRLAAGRNGPGIAPSAADRRLALDATLLLGLATFLWDYSQAAWPHATAALFVLAAFAAVVRSIQATERRRSLAWAAAAGLLAGLAPGIRLDGAFALVLVLPFLFQRPTRWRDGLAFTLGALPPLVALAAVNAVKFGEWTPLTYGREGSGANTGLTPYLPLLTAGLVVLAAAWVLSRPSMVARWMPWLRGARRWAVPAVAMVALATLVLVLPPLRELAARIADGAAQLLLDLRFRDPALREPAMARTPSGAVVYIGGFKKALLQSIPWVAALVLPAGVAASKVRWRAPVLLLALVPTAYLAPYSLFAWHGGLSLNLRYFVPILPFLAILGALAARRLEGPGEGRLVPWSTAAGAALALVLASFGTLTTLPLEPLEPLLLDLPLVLAGALAVLAAALTMTEPRSGSAVAERASTEVTARSAAGNRRPSPLRRVASGVFALAVIHATVVTFAYDVPLAESHRSRNLEAAGRILPLVEPDSILFAPYPDPYFGLLEVERLRLAIPFADDFRDFRSLVDLHLDQGRPVYASLPPPIWRALGQQGRLQGLQLVPLLPDGFVLRVERTPEAESTEEASAPVPPAPEERRDD